MLKKFSDDEFIRLKNGLQRISSRQEQAHVTLADELACIAGAMDNLNGFVTENGFSDPAQEIDYYKNIYPTFQSLHVYQAELYRLEASIPDWDSRSLKKFFRSKLQRITEDVEGEKLHYNYFKLSADDLDDLYFRKEPGRYSVLMPVLAEPMSFGIPPMSRLFARFRAAEMLHRYIQKRLEELAPDTLKNGRQRKTLRWTGPVIHLIEVAYGIHLNAQVNDGEIGIVEFFGLLGEYFGVNLGVPKKGFDDLKKRKRLSKTHFTDMIRESLLYEMDEQDRWTPGS